MRLWTISLSLFDIKMLTISMSIVLLLLLSTSRHTQAHPAIDLSQSNSTLEKRVGSGCPGDKEATIRSYTNKVLGLQGKFPSIPPVRLPDFLRLCNFQPGENVLDIGSGLGEVAFEARKKVGEKGQVVGIDLTPEAIKRAEKSALRQDLKNVQFLVGDVNELEPILGKLGITYDVIVCSSAFQYADDPEETLRVWYRFLKPGGRIVFDLIPHDVAPTLGADHKAINELRIPFLNMGVWTMFGSQKRLSALIKKTGFQGAVTKSKVYRTFPISREEGQRMTLGRIRSSLYNCFEGPELEEKTIEIYRTEFDRRADRQGLVWLSWYYYDVVAKKPDKDLRR